MQVAVCPADKLVLISDGVSSWFPTWDVNTQKYLGDNNWTIIKGCHPNDMVSIDVSLNNSSDLPISTETSIHGFSWGFGLVLASFMMGYGVKQIVKALNLM